ncbi:MAG: hypothetical protein QOH25_3883 [Acidobacteriota bacterium]|jgi:DNA-binding transcriptional regulator YiaG|nr:hypothetical protein [Acidobacteriota bacterium]
MFHALKGYLRGFSRNGFTLSAARLGCAVMLALLLPVVACAYTVILRSGRRLEIPATFTVTKLTLTYEASPGINITLLMSSIDIEATERANKEPAGGLLKRAEQQATARSVATRSRASRRELTKQDIEAARRARQMSEQEYERRRMELGLPSLEEVRRRNDEETKRLSETARQSRMEEVQAENYWRTRSTQLRTEIAALDAQVIYVRARLAEIPEGVDVGTYGLVTNVAPTFRWRHPATRFPVVTGNPGFMRGNTSGAQVTGFLAFGGATPPGRVRLNAGLASRGFGRRGGIAQGIIAPAVTSFGVPYANYDYAGERANLIFRLHELEAAQAGLQTRWRLLEEEARRAGAQPGWLRQ